MGYAASLSVSSYDHKTLIRFSGLQLNRQCEGCALPEDRGAERRWDCKGKEAGISFKGSVMQCEYTS